MTNRWTTNGTPEDGDGFDHRSTRTTMPTQIQPLTRRVSDGSSGLGVVAGEGVGDGAGAGLRDAKSVSRRHSNTAR